MAKVCTFCGLQLPRFGARELICGSVNQPACRDCYYKYMETSAEERCRLALDSGRAAAPMAIRDSLSKLERQREEKRQAKLSGMTCLRCGGAMLKMGRHQLQMGEENFFFDTHMFAGSLEVDIHQCEQCRKMEFFAPDPAVEKKKAEAAPQVTCAACGTVHSADIGCPNCALSAATFGRRPEAAPAKKKDPKAPWEK